MPGKLLIVDGRKTAAFLLQKQFCDFDIECATNGGQALKIFNQVRPDMVIMNIQTPGMDGYAVLRVLKSATHFAYIPVLVVGPVDDPHERLACLEAGADGFLAEPYNIREMKAVMLNLSRQKKIQDNMRKALESMVRLVAQLEEQDEYLKGHALRTAYYAVELSKEMTFIKSFHEQIRIAAMIHDIGMLSVDQSICRKNGKLSEDDQSMIRMHITKVLELCQTIPFYDGLDDSVKYHHERFDGSGYPEGLAGDAIPLGARILSLVDAYDALTMKRAYREAKTVDEAVEILKRNEGPQWDPRCVARFIKLIEAGRLNPASLVCDTVTGDCHVQ